MRDFYESDSFKENLDKITEAEMVYNILERLKFGNDIQLGSYIDRNQGDVVYPENTKLINCIRHLLSCIPPSLLDYSDDMKAVVIEIPKGYRFVNAGFVMDRSSDRYSVITAYSEKARIDVTSIVKNPQHTGFLCNISLDFDTGYPYDDNIVVYLKKTN